MSGKEGNTSGSVFDPLLKAASDVGNTVANAVKSLGSQTVKWVDQNGDGKFDQEDVMIILKAVYDQSTNGIPMVSKPITDIADEYMKRFPDTGKAARKLIENAIIKCTTSGFLSGFGGVITMPVTIPANVSSVLYVQMRMIAAVAYMAGLDLKTDATQTLVYACLAGISVAEIVKAAGIQFGLKFTNAMVKKIPGKVLTRINQKVGFRFITKFGQTGIINIGKMIPVVGAVIGGGFDFAETKIIADRAYKEFIEGDYQISDADSEKEIIIEEPLSSKDEPVTDSETEVGDETGSEYGTEPGPEEESLG